MNKDLVVKGLALSFIECAQTTLNKVSMSLGKQDFIAAWRDLSTANYQFARAAVYFLMGKSWTLGDKKNINDALTDLMGHLDGACAQIPGEYQI